MSTEGQICLARGQGTHEHITMFDGVHTNAVAQQGTAGLSLRRIYRHYRDALIGKVHGKTANQFIHHRALPCPTRSGNSKNRGVYGSRFLGN